MSATDIPAEAIEAGSQALIGSQIDAKAAEGMVKNWTPAAIRAFQIAARIARGGLL